MDAPRTPKSKRSCKPTLHDDSSGAAPIEAQWWPLGLSADELDLQATLFRSVATPRSTAPPVRALPSLMLHGVCVCVRVCGSGQSFRWVQHGREFFVGVVGDDVVSLRYAETASRSAPCTHQVVYRPLNTAATYDAARHAALGDRLRDYFNAQVDLLVRGRCPAQLASWPSLAVCVRLLKSCEISQLVRLKGNCQT